MQRLLFNSDGDSLTLSHFSPPIDHRQLCRVLDELVGTAVGVFLYSLNRGGDTYSHFTSAGEVFGAKVSRWDGVMARVRRKAENIRRLHAAGIDPLAVMAERARQLGFEFWPSLRMNDIHEDDSGRFWVHRSRFKEQHPELLLGSPYPDPGQGYPQDDFTWAFDYNRPEVRQRRLALVEEVCKNYPLDGFELDFQRGPWYFKAGAEAAGMEAMSDLVYAVRQILDAYAPGRDQRPSLAIRVPPQLQACERLGLDVARWLGEGWIDLCTPMSGGYLDMSADIGGFAAVAAKGCRIAGGLERYVYGYGRRCASPAMLYAAAAGYLHQGAADVYLFNFDCHRWGGIAAPYTPEETAMLTTLGDGERLRQAPHHYLVPRDRSDRSAREGGTALLPLDLAVGETATVQLNVGRNQSHTGSLLTMTADPKSSAKVAVVLNDRSLTAAAITAEGVWSFAVPNLRLGGNQLKIKGPGRINGIELVVGQP